MGGGGGGLDIMHGRSRMTLLDPHIPTISGRSTSGFHRPGRHCSLHQAYCRDNQGWMDVGGG